MRIHSAGRVGFFFASSLVLSACGGGSSSPSTELADAGDVVDDVPVEPATQAPVVETLVPNDPIAPVVVSAPVAPVVITTEPTTPAAPVVETTTPVTEPVVAQPAAPTVPVSVTAPPTDQTPVQGTVPALVASNAAAGIDVSGGNDDSPTETESLSLVGPFLRDESRSAGPPSVPTGLVALMSSNDWVEFSWVPSVDDQSVEAYEILRDGTSVFTIRGDSGYEFDYRSWISTTYMDCNFTRYATCEGDQPASGSTHEYSVIAIDNEGARSAPSAPVSITLPQAQMTQVDLAGYELVLDEEFDEDTLDRSVWKTSLAWGADTIVNGELQYFVNLFDNDEVAYDPFVLTGSTLQITGIRTPAADLSNANDQPYLSGVLNSQDNFSFTYGYVEMNAKVAAGGGLLSTFYLFNQSFDDNKPEIDILEYIGDRPDKAYQTYHYFDSNRTRYGTGEGHSSPTMEHEAGFDLSSGFHNYSVLWEPELVIWYIDGVEIRRIEGPRVSAEPMNIIAHLVLGSIWIGEPEDSAIPAVFEIDYIKAWQRQ